MTSLVTVFAQSSAQPHPIISFLPLILMFGIFYFLLIRPQQKKQKDHQAFLAGLAKNQEVVTSGGIHGTIVNVKEKSAILRIADNVKVEIEKKCHFFLQAAITTHECPYS